MKSTHEIALSETKIPRYVQSLMILDAKGLSLEDVSTSITTTQANGETKTTQVSRIPMIDLIYVDQEHLDNAVLRAMGYEDSSLN